MHLMSQLPSTLYHYTSLSGLLGIVNSGQIWASHIRYLNDRSEQEHLWSLVKKRVSDKLSSAKSSKAKDSLRLLLSTIEDLPNKDVYVTSFSSESDLLSQWLSYCPEGNGFAIGFDLKSVYGIRDGKPWWEAKKQPGMSLSPVLYLSAQNAGAVDTLIDYFSGEKEIPNKDILNVEAGPAGDFVRALLSPKNLGYGLLSFLESRVKDPSFAAEKECRLLLEGDNGALHFRPGKSMLVPYKIFQFDAEAPYFIEEVVVGPCPNPELSVASLNMLFASIGRPSVQVLQSSIPYRSW